MSDVTPDMSVPLHDMPSHGFVEVGQGTNPEGTYNLLKRTSYTFGDIGKTNGTRATPHTTPHSFHIN
jgi:hypothetical protein